MYSKVERLMEEHKTTAYRVSIETGVPTSTFSDWKAGRYTPKYDKVKKIADYFGVTVEYLLDQED